MDGDALELCAPIPANAYGSAKPPRIPASPPKLSPSTTSPSPVHLRGANEADAEGDGMLDSAKPKVPRTPIAPLPRVRPKPPSPLLPTIELSIDVKICAELEACPRRVQGSKRV